MKCGKCDSEMECIVDFNGSTAIGSFPTAFWADWCPECKEVHFGGDWSDIPDLKSETCPDDDTVSGYANKMET